MTSMLKLRLPRWTALSTLALCALALLCATGCSPEAPKPVHVLLVVVDTLRAEHLSCYGYGRQTSPHIDQLANGGARFAYATSQCSWTAPSMVSMFTGRHILEERLSLPAELPTLPELFKKSGYRTGAFVVNPILHNKENGFRRGFDRFEPNAEFREIGAWITQSSGTPTFTWVHWVDPHDPYGPAKEYEHFAKSGDALSSELSSYYAEVTRRNELDEADQSRETVRASIDGYDDDIRLVDSKIDILVRALEQAGILEQSVIALASDHGEGLWHHQNYPVAEELTEPATLLSTHKMTHGNHLYEEQVHVPLLFFGLGVPAGRVVEAPVENVDLLPTLLELCNLPIPPGTTGSSLVPLFHGEDASRAAFAVSTTRWVMSLRTRAGMKLILPTQQGREIGLEPELYDLSQDPFERVNLAASQPEKLAELSALLRDRLASGLRADGDEELSEANRKAMEDLGYF